MRQQYLSPGLIRYYKDPLMIVEGHMQYVWDESGKRYLDGFAGIVTVSVGHCHPKIVQAVQKQVGKLQHTTTIYLHPTIGQFAKKLTEHMPAEFRSCRAGTSPTAARKPTSWRSSPGANTRRTCDIISLRNAYHGGTAATMNLTAHGNVEIQIQPRHSPSKTPRRDIVIAVRTA